MIKLKSLVEGYFHLPHDVIKPVIDVYIENYKKFKINKVKRVTDKSFPNIQIPIDFKNSNFKFLNELNPYIVIKFTKDNSAFLGFNSTYGKLKNNPVSVGVIELSLYRGPREIYDVIEHELLHFVQELIKKYKEIKYKKQSSDTMMGGLPSPKLISKDVDIHGYKKRPDSEYYRNLKRVSHSKRPIEYYPDLLSSIRELQYLFYKKAEKENNLDNWDSIKNSNQLKKEFFIEFIKSINSNLIGRTGFEFSISARVFIEFKKISEDFYKKMLSIAYDSFVNKSINFDHSSISNLENYIKSELDKRPIEIPIDKFKFLNSYLKINYAADIFDKVPDSIPIEDGRSDSAHSIFDAIGIKEKHSDYGFNFVLPTSEKAIKNLFSQLKHLKIYKRNYYLRFENNREITDEELNAIYDSIYEYIREMYINAINFGDVNKLKNIIDSSYKN